MITGRIQVAKLKSFPIRQLLMHSAEKKVGRATTTMPIHYPITSARNSLSWRAISRAAWD